MLDDSVEWPKNWTPDQRMQNPRASLEERNLTLTTLGIGMSGLVPKSPGGQHGIAVESGNAELVATHCDRVVWWCSDQGVDFVVPESARIIGSDADLRRVREVAGKSERGDADLFCGPISTARLYPNALKHCDLMYVFGGLGRSCYCRARVCIN